MLNHPFTPPPNGGSSIHSGIILSAFYFIFPSLVESPHATLLQSLPFLAALQAFYNTQFFPRPGTPSSFPSSSSSTTTTTSSSSSSISARKSKKIAPQTLSTKLIQAVLVLALAIVGGLVILFPILVAFGAPITTHIPETVLTALHVALLAGFPLVWKCGVDSAKWREVVAMQAGVDEAIGGAMGACVGAWLGAVPIPLDWDKEWQKWPVTLVTGAYIGYVIGKGMGSWMNGRKLPF